jgi:predicted NUDIX family NTP pyrophosphohydrolase
MPVAKKMQVFKKCERVGDFRAAQFQTQVIKRKQNSLSILISKREC